MDVKTDEGIDGGGVNNPGFNRVEDGKIMDNRSTCVFYTTASNSVLTMDTETQVQKDGLLVTSSTNGDAPSPTDEKMETKSLLEKLKNQAYRFKFIQSLSLSFAFWSLGYQIGQRGPSFLDIQIITGTNVERASTFFTAGSVGYLSGSLVSGIIYDKFNKTLLLSITLTSMALTVAVLPLCSPYVLMLVIFWANSTCMGWLDTGGNAYLMSLWGEKDGGPYVQAGHFAFAFGGVISPLVTNPFLAPKAQEPRFNTSSTGLNTSSTDLTSTTIPNINISLPPIYNTNMTNFTNVFNSNVTHIDHPPETQLIYAYIISGVLTLLSAIPFIVVYCRSRSKKRRLSIKKEEDKPPKRDLPLVYYILTLVILCLMYVFYSSVEDTFAAYLATFVVLHLKWSKSHGSSITSVYWAAFAISRFSGIFFIGCLRPVVMIFICMTSMVLSLTGFLICSYYYLDSGIWIFAILVGLSESVIFPTGLTWAHNSLFKLTGKLTSCILIASSMGTMLNPIIIGYLMQEHDPMWYSYLLLGESILCFSVFLILVLFSKLVLNKVRIVETITVDTSMDEMKSIDKKVSLTDDNVD